VRSQGAPIIHFSLPIDELEMENTVDFQFSISFFAMGIGIGIFDGLAYFRWNNKLMEGTWITLDTLCLLRSFYRTGNHYVDGS